MLRAMPVGSAWKGFESERVFITDVGGVEANNVRECGERRQIKLGSSERV